MRPIDFLIIHILYFPLAICGINWNGNWAFSCDFQDRDLSNARVPGEHCSTKCTQTPGCTHFTWTTYNGGTCWMKTGSVSKNDAFPTSDRSAVCGLLQDSIPNPGPR